MSGEQDVVGPYLDQHPAAGRPVEEPDDQAGAIVETEVAGSLIGGVTVDSCREDVANTFERDRSVHGATRLTEDIQGRSLGDDPPLLQQEQAGSQRDGLGCAVGDVEHGDRLGALDDAEAIEERVTIGKVERGDRLIAE